MTRGFVLVEVVLALLLLLVGALAYCAALGSAATALRRGEMLDGAVAIAERTADSLAVSTSPAADTAAEGIYRLSWAPAGVALMRLDVRWNDGRDRAFALLVPMLGSAN
ncbi:MAG: hypothetical protein ACRELD_03665 [Longimicrobiales bacterium]